MPSSPGRFRPLTVFPDPSLTVDVSHKKRWLRSTRKSSHRSLLKKALANIDVILFDNSRNSRVEASEGILNILPSLTKGRGLLPSRLRRDLGGFLLLTPSFRVHLAGHPGMMRPWVYSTNLVFEMQKLGFSFSRESFSTRRASLAALSIPALKDGAFRAIWENNPMLATLPDPSLWLRQLESVRRSTHKEPDEAEE